MVREASDRVLGLRPFDVQLIGGMVRLARALPQSAIAAHANAGLRHR